MEKWGERGEGKEKEKGRRVNEREKGERRLWNPPPPGEAPRKGEKRVREGEAKR